MDTDGGGIAPALTNIIRHPYYKACLMMHLLDFC